MKTFFISIFLIFTVSVNAQTIVEKPLETALISETPKHVYFKDINNQLNKYVGTWEYNQNGHYFKITFFKQTYFRTTPVQNSKVTEFIDRIYGYYQYKLNGVEIYNVTSQNIAYSTMGAFAFGNFRISFNEPASSCVRDKEGDVTLVHSVVNGVEKLTWSRTDRLVGFYSDCFPRDETPFQTPANMVLTKVTGGLIIQD